MWLELFDDFLGGHSMEWLVNVEHVLLDDLEDSLAEDLGVRGRGH
jgi:hypothetical protein